MLGGYALIAALVIGTVYFKRRLRRKRRRCIENLPSDDGNDDYIPSIAQVVSPWVPPAKEMPSGFLRERSRSPQLEQIMMDTTHPIHVGTFVQVHPEFALAVPTDTMATIQQATSKHGKFCNFMSRY